MTGGSSSLATSVFAITSQPSVPFEPADDVVGRVCFSWRSSDGVRFFGFVEHDRSYNSVPGDRPPGSDYRGFF